MTTKFIALKKDSFGFVDSERLFRELDVKEDTVFLDAACGCGDYALAAASRIGSQGRIFAFDLCEAGIDRLMDEIVVRGITNIAPRVVDLCSLPLGDETIDICLMSTVFHGLVQQGNDQRALVEIKRVLKPSGVLAVIEFKKVSGISCLPVNICISPAELDETLHLYGFTPLKKQEIEVGPYSYLTLYCKATGNLDGMGSR